MTQGNRRVLLIDDSSAIHDDFRKILGTPARESTSASQARAGFLGGGGEPPDPAPESETFDLVSAMQGEEGLELLRSSQAEGKPFAMAFVDVRMPPGWDGIRTISELWKADENLQVVICTAYSDYSWSETLDRLPHTDRLLILKKPFDPVEICQLATALTAKWDIAQRERDLIAGLRRAEQEARSYCSSLETVNRALETSKASAESGARSMGEFLVRLSSELQGGLTTVLQPIIEGVSMDPGGSFELERSLTIATRLLGSLDELHDLCLLETGRLTNEPTACSPVELARTAILELAPIAEALGVRIAAEFDGPLPETIEVDGRRVGQILRQLIRNGVEHAEARHVTLRTSTAQTSDWKRPHIRFDIVDDGIGIPPEHQASIFAPFVRLEDAPSAAGTGIGLTLARRIANMVRADLTVQSNVGQGSTFRLELETSSVSGVRMIEAD